MRRRQLVFGSTVVLATLAGIWSVLPHSKEQSATYQSASKPRLGEVGPAPSTEPTVNLELHGGATIAGNDHALTQEPRTARQVLASSPWGDRIVSLLESEGKVIDELVPPPPLEAVWPRLFDEARLTEEEQRGLVATTLDWNDEWSLADIGSKLGVEIPPTAGGAELGLIREEARIHNHDIERLLADYYRDLDLAIVREIEVGRAQFAPYTTRANPIYDPRGSVFYSGSVGHSAWTCKVELTREEHPMLVEDKTSIRHLIHARNTALRRLIRSLE
jgi:hypothetical protein